MKSWSHLLRFTESALLIALVALSIGAAIELARAQIVGGYNVGFSPQAAVSFRNSPIAQTGFRPEQSWFGNTAGAYHPFAAYSPPAKPFSSPQFWRSERPLITSMDMARYEINRGLLWGAY